MLDPAQKREVQASYAQLAQNTVGAAFAFYEALFAACPHLRGLFPEDMGPQAAKLASSLSALIASLERDELPLDYLRDLGARHAARGVHPDHYSAVRAALLETLSATPGWTPGTSEAWTRLLDMVSAAMIEGAELRCA